MVHSREIEGVDSLGLLTERADELAQNVDWIIYATDEDLISKSTVHTSHKLEPRLYGASYFDNDSTFKSQGVDNWIHSEYHYPDMAHHMMHQSFADYSYAKSKTRDMMKQYMALYHTIAGATIVKPDKISYELPSGETIIISSKLSELVAKIDDSKYLIDYRDEDENGEVTIYELATWVKAVRFLLFMADVSIQHNNFPTPNITDGPDGSIDIHWESDAYRLLVNVPSTEEPINFYGDNHRSFKLKGTFSETEYTKLSVSGLLSIIMPNE